MSSLLNFTNGTVPWSTLITRGTVHNVIIMVTFSKDDIPLNVVVTLKSLQALWGPQSEFSSHSP